MGSAPHSSSKDLIRSLLAESSIASSKPAVLVVDDDAAVRRICRSVLEREGWRVDEATDGLAAINQCQTDGPDIILLNIKLPKMNGVEATRHFRSMAATEGIPIVLLADQSDAASIRQGLHAGADNYICKPFTADDFTQRVRSFTRLQRAWRELKQGRSTLGEQARALSLLLDFGEALSKRDDLTSILDKLVEVSAELTSCSRVSVMLPDEEDRFLWIAAAIGIDEQIKRNVELRIGASIAGRVFVTGREIMLNDQRAVESALDPRDLRVFQGLPMVSMPLCASEKVIGVLNLTSRIDERPFDALEIGYLSLFTNYAASEIRNVQLREARDRARDSIVVALAKLAEHRANDSGRHIDRIVLFSTRLAEVLRRNPVYARLIDDEFIRNLRRAAPLHDVGKVAVPDAILLKPGGLSEREMEIMRSHAGVGAETIRTVLRRVPDSGFLKLAEEIALSHHEWFDGSGYPNGLAGDAIPLSARIVALADVYDALTTRRVYREAYPHRKSVEIILKESATHFDPDIVNAFLELEPEFERLGQELADEQDTTGEFAEHLAGSRVEPLAMPRA